MITPTLTVGQMLFRRSRELILVHFDFLNRKRNRTDRTYRTYRKKLLILWVLLVLLVLYDLYPYTSRPHACGCVPQLLVVFEGVLGFHILVHNLPDGLDHRNGGLGLEDISSHVHARRTVRDRVVSHAQGVELRQFLASGDHDRDRAGRGDRLETRDIVGFYEGGAQLGQDS